MQLPHVSVRTSSLFNDFLNHNTIYTRDEGNIHHYCVFFLPYDQADKKVYLGNHIKAQEWIPPGGHIDEGEHPLETVKREALEELKLQLTDDIIEPFDLSVKPIGRGNIDGCETHFDIWHLIHIHEQYFAYDRQEYYDAKWFTIDDALGKIDKSPEFREVMAKLHSR